MAKTTSLIQLQQKALRTQAIVAIVFGLLAILWPGLTAFVLIRLLALFLLVDAFILFFNAFSSWEHVSRATLYVLLGLVQLVLGFILFANPALAIGTLIAVLGIVLIVRGLFSLIHALVLHGAGMDESKTTHALLAVLGIIVGIVILFQPVASGIAFVWVLGFYALLSGVLLLVAANNIKVAITKSRAKKK